MTLDTKHVKRKELGKYLPQEVFKSTKVVKNNTKVIFLTKFLFKIYD